MLSDNHVRVIVLSIVVALSLPTRAPAQASPPVPDSLKRHFVVYRDSRGFIEKALNKIGMSKQELGRSFALVAGVSDYPNMSPMHRRLEPAAEDIRKLVAYLTEQEFMDEIVLLRNQDVTYNNLAYFLQTYFPTRLKAFPMSRFLFAYSGHGAVDAAEGFLLLNTARDLTDLEHSVSLAVLRSLLERDVQANQRVLVLINSCYSGAFARRSFGGRLTPSQPGAHAITAGAAKELVWADDRLGKGSIFFEALFNGLDGRADLYPAPQGAAPGDGIVTVEELYTYLKNEIQRHTNEETNPQWGDLSAKGSQGGFFFLNRSRQLASGATKPWNPARGTAFGPNAEADLRRGNEAYDAGQFETALKLFMSAADAGHPQAMYFVGYMYRKGIGVVAADTAEAVRWYLKGAEAGNTEAIRAYGSALLDGEGVAQNQPEGVRWIRKSADLGNAYAMVWLGWAYEKGRGVAADTLEALKWYRKSAEAGSADGMNNLGTFYRDGYGVAQNYSEALRWYKKAIEGRSSLAMQNLGWMYEKGVGVPQDYAEAVHWYKQAAALGEGWSRSRLQRLGATR